jgi:hypothetical protein
MLASRRTSVSQPEPRHPVSRERGRDRGRGIWPGRGAGTFQSQKRSSQEAELDANEEGGETMKSPLKPTTGAADGMDNDNGARRNLNFDTENISVEDTGGAAMIRLKCIYNFLCFMLVLHQFIYVLLMFRCTFIHFTSLTY